MQKINNFLAIFGSQNSRDYTVIIPGFRDCKIVRDHMIRDLGIPGLTALMRIHGQYC